MTGMLLDLPLSAILVYTGLSGGFQPGHMFLSTSLISIMVIACLKGLLALGKLLRHQP